MVLGILLSVSPFGRKIRNDYFVYQLFLKKKKNSKSLKYEHILFSDSACGVFRHTLPHHAYTHYLPSNNHIPSPPRSLTVAQKAVSVYI